MKDAAGTDKTPEEVAQMLDDNLSDLMTDLYSIAMTQYDSYEYLWSTTMTSLETVTQRSLQK